MRALGSSPRGALSMKSRPSVLDWNGQSTANINRSMPIASIVHLQRAVQEFSAGASESKRKFAQLFKFASFN
jgi:hypothetical protein